LTCTSQRRHQLLFVYKFDFWSAELKIIDPILLATPKSTPDGRRAMRNAAPRILLIEFYSSLHHGNQSAARQPTFYGMTYCKRGDVRTAIDHNLWLIIAQVPIRRRPSTFYGVFASLLEVAGTIRIYSDSGRRVTIKKQAGRARIRCALVLRQPLPVHRVWENVRTLQWYPRNLFCGFDA